ncbi:hypothetical protein [Endozoicomonas sp.]|uniref:hypothetical protein n=1 Tax=Endozoicomonas sp. TaxID=1892382 RepID=UPI00383A7ECA
MMDVIGIKNFSYQDDKNVAKEHSKPNHDCTFRGCQIGFLDGKSYVGTFTASQLRAILVNYYYVDDNWKQNKECFLNRCMLKAVPVPDPKNLLTEVYNQAVNRADSAGK